MLACSCAFGRGLLATALALAGWTGAAWAQPGVQPPANGYAHRPSVSADGRFVAFISEASNLVRGDTNGRDDVFIADRLAGSIERASLGPSGGQIEGYLYSANLSRNGEHLVYVLDRGIYALDRASGVVRLASVSSTGAPDIGRGVATISDDGRYVAFAAFYGLVPEDTDFTLDVYVRDLELETTSLVSASPVAGSSYDPVISADGNRIAFTSTAQLVPEDTNGACDVYRWRRSDGLVQLVSALPATGQAATTDCGGLDSPGHDLSPDGDTVVFASSASALVSPPTNGNQNIFRRNLRPQGGIELVSFAADGQPDTSPRYLPRVSPNGRYVVYYGGFGGSEVVTVVDRTVAPGGAGRQAQRPGRGHAAVDDNGAIAWPTLDLGAFGGPPAAFLPQVVLENTFQASAPELLSALREGPVGSGHVRSVALSGDGRVVGFTSEAANLVPSDQNAAADAFVRDTASGAIELVSVNQDGDPADGPSHSLDVSGDGRYVAFLSRASNLVDGDDSFTVDLFRKDRTTGAVVKVNPNTGGLETPDPLRSPYLRPSISADGRWVGYFATAPELGTEPSGREAFVTDVQNTMTIRLTAGPVGEAATGDSFGVDVASGGQWVAFDSRSTQIVPGDTNNDLDVFVYDLETGQRERVSTTAAGEQADAGSNGFPQISGDGRYVAFQSCSPNLVGNSGCALVRKDRQTGALVVKQTGVVVPLDLSDDGRYVIAMVAFAPVPTHRASGEIDFAEVYRYDLESADAVWVTRSSVGEAPNGRAAQPEGAISGDGERVAFASSSDNYLPDDANFARDAFVVDLPTQALQIVSRPGGLPRQGDLVNPAMSGAGNRLVAESRDRAGVFTAGGGGAGTKRVAGDPGGYTGIQLFDQATGRARRVDVGVNGAPANGNSSDPAISGNGNKVTFTSEATNLVGNPPPQGPKPESAVYMADAGVTGGMILMSPPFDNQPLNGPTTASAVAVEGDGDAVVVMTSAASNLVAGDTNGVADVVVAVAPAGGGAPQLEIISRGAGGEPGNAPSVEADVSPDGQFVAWSSLADNLPTGSGGDFNSDWDIYLRDRTGAVTICMTNGGNGPSKKPDIISFGGGGGGGPDGGGGAGGAIWFAVWESRANNLAAGDGNPESDVFLKSNQGSGQTVLVSRAFTGGPANGPSYAPSISADARFVTFTSLASNLVQDDTNNAADIFVYDVSLGFGSIRRVSQTASAQANQFSMGASVASVNGQPVVAWDTAATNLAGEDDSAFDVTIRTGTAAPVQLEPPLFADGFE